MITKFLVLGILAFAFIMWSYIIARMVTRAVLRSMKEQDNGKR